MNKKIVFLASSFALVLFAAGAAIGWSCRGERDGDQSAPWQMSIMMPDGTKPPAPPQIDGGKLRFTAASSSAAAPTDFLIQTVEIFSHDHIIQVTGTTVKDWNRPFDPYRP